MGKVIWIFGAVLFALIDILFLPIYWLGVLLFEASQVIFSVTDEGGMILTKEWIKKSRGLVPWNK